MASKDETDQLSEADRAFARSMRAARERAGWNQEQLAKLVNDLGGELTQATVSRIEGSRRAARLGEARLIAAALGEQLEAMSSPDSRAGFLRDIRHETREAWRSYLALRETAESLGGSTSALRLTLGLIQGGVAAAEGEGSDEFDELIRERVKEAERVLAVDVLQSVREAYERGAGDGTAADAAQ